MSDVATTPAAPDLATLIMSVAEPVWKKISAVLKVQTREEAVQLCQQDPEAAATVVQIIQGQTALTQQAPKQQPTALTSQSGITVPSAAERIYGSAKAKLSY